jgi:hypothetical protein
MAEFSELCPVSASIEYSTADRALQLRDAGGESRLRDVQVFRGAAEGTVCSNRCKMTELLRF